MNQELVKFGSDNLLVVAQNDKRYFSIRYVCVALGLDAKQQVRRIKTDAVLKAEACQLQIRSGNQMRKLTFLSMEYLQGWLFRINSANVNPAVKSKLESYQRDCYRILNGSHERLRVAQTEKFMKLQRIKELDDLINGLPNYQEYSQERKRLKKDVANLEMDTFQQLKLM